MKLEQLGLNRFGYKAMQNVGTPDSQALSANNSGAVPNPANNISQPKDNSKNARNIITGTVITSCFIQTSALPNRVEIADNDATFFDDSEGGGGQIQGDTASIRFVRADSRPGTFIIQKRHGVNNNDENVLEMFYDENAGSSQNNYIFIGRQGNSPATNHTDFVVLHGVNSVRMEINRIHDYQSRPPIVTFDYNKVDPSKEGIISLLLSEGKDGFVGVGQMAELLTFSDSPSFAVGDTITGNATGATGKIIYKIDANNYAINHTSYGVQFNPATDNACTTNGAGGGSGTGNLSATSYINLLLLYTDNALNVILGNPLVPDQNNAYDIGTLSARIRNIRVGGRMTVGSVTDAGPMTATNGTQGDIVFNTSNSKFYGCTVTGTPATWVALN